VFFFSLQEQWTAGFEPAPKVCLLTFFLILLLIISNLYSKLERELQGSGVTTLFLLLLLLWTLELYSILSYRYEDLLISWSYRSYLDLLILSSDDDPRYIFFTLLLTCIWHAFDSCLSLTIDMHSTHVAAQHAFTICFTCVCLEDNAWTLVYKP